jgi:hypothetical protein
MKKRLDAKMYKIHKTCFDCVVEMEAKLKREGKYEEYERKMMIDNAKDMVDDYETYLLEAINTSNTQYVSEKGEVERWKGGIDKEKLTKEIKEAVLEFKEKLEKND